MTTAGQIAAYRFQPREAIPQILTADKDIKAVLSVIKSILEVRDGRSGSKSERFVTLGELEYALSKLNLTGSTVEAEVLSEVMPAKEAMKAGDFISVFTDGAVVKARKACGLVDETNDFKNCNGYILDDCAMGSDVTVYYGGINTKYSKFEDLTVGTVVYNSDTAGEVSQTRKTGAKLQMVGMVVKAGILFVPGDVVTDCCGSCVYYGDTSNCDTVVGEIVPVMIADSSGLSDQVSDKVFNTIGAAIVYAGSENLISRVNIVLDFASEDPDCSAAMNMFGVEAG